MGLDQHIDIIKPNKIESDNYYDFNDEFYWGKHYFLSKFMHNIFNTRNHHKQEYGEKVNLTLDDIILLKIYVDNNWSEYIKHLETDGYWDNEHEIYEIYGIDHIIKAAIRNANCYKEQDYKFIKKSIELFKKKYNILYYEYS